MAARDIRWKLHLASGPHAVWPLLTTDAGRERFWCERSEQIGDTISMSFSNGWVEHATVLTSHPPGRFSVRYFGTPVTFTVEADGSGGTDLEVVHEGVSETEFHEVLPGWLNVLFPLKGVVDFGIDLRNHDPARSWDEGYCDG
jgi:uncharacterized protein YndB with AHSA1/START domain